MKKIIAIGGPTGVGKTDTSWSLLEKLNKKGLSCVLMDADWYANERPFDWDKMQDLDSVFQQINLLLKHHFVDRGKEIILMPHCHQISQNHEKLKEICDGYNADLSLILLLCDPSTLINRINNRDRLEEQKAQEMKDAKKQANILSMINKNNPVWLDIDNSNLTEEQTAELILDQLL